MTTGMARAGTAVLFAAVLLIAQATVAAELVLPARESAVVSNPADAGECRLLLALERPVELERAEVLLAVLLVELPLADRIGEVPPVEVFLCEREWLEGLVSWDGGWESGEGVWDESAGAFVDIERSGSGVVLTADVTGVLRTAVEGSTDQPVLILVPWLTVPGLAAALQECSAWIDVEWMPAERVNRGHH